jgi:hypothetical protein
MWDDGYGSSSPKPKKHHSKDKLNSGNNLPATIAKLEAYSKRLQSKEYENNGEDHYLGL